MRSSLTSVLLGLSLFFIHTSQAASLSPLWELSGFSGPESVYVSPEHQWVYVTNINGKQNGFISKLSKDGQLSQLKWVDGLGMPTGMGMLENNLYVADGKQVHVIDVVTGNILQSIKAKDAVMLNDLTISNAGQIFVGDIASGKIYTIVEGELVVWLENENLPHPNGLLVQGNTLIAANMASKLAQQLEPDEFGSVYKIDLASKSVTLMNTSYRLGGLDGVTELNGSLIASHFPAGEIYQITDSERILLGTVDVSAADINIDDSSNTLFIPFLFNGKVASYKITNE